MTFQPATRKRDALRRIAALLGQDYEIGVGSSIPTQMFTDAARRAHVSTDGAMPERAQRIVESVGVAWPDDGDSRHTPTGGGSTVTLPGLNAVLQALEILAGRPEDPLSDTEDSGALGTPYVPHDGGVEAMPRELIQDWSALDRSSRAHQKLEQSLAEFARSQGAEPRSHAAAEPAYDLAWEYDDCRVLVEVKSTTPGNHRQQVRLGIGQICEFVVRQESAAPGNYAAVLLIGEAPTPVDKLLGGATGVFVIGPEDFDSLVERGLLPGGA